MIHFYKLTVDDIRIETADCISVSFAVPTEVKELFNYRAGQYLTLRVYVNGQEIRRSYSICSSPFDDELRIAIKKIEGGAFSDYANNILKKGDTVEVMPPLGKFHTALDAGQAKNYVAIAAGSGITPIFSIIKTTLLTEPNSNFTLVFGNRNRQSIIFKDAIDALKNRFVNRFSVMHILSREKMDTPLNFGRIDMAKCDVLFSKAIAVEHIDEFFVCGPEELIETVTSCLEAMGVEKKRIHFELFTAIGLKRTVGSTEKKAVPTEAKSKVTIKLDGTFFDFELGFDDQNILDAALQHGADLPFSCKGGVCCTCRAKLLEGEVDMDVNYGLEPEEVEQGFILTCQSHPRTEKIVVDFDVR